ncbi:hypothetical protein ACHAXR_010456 [Thalassiosira sp. AJA248-18]
MPKQLQRTLLTAILSATGIISLPTTYAAEANYGTKDCQQDDGNAHQECTALHQDEDEYPTDAHEVGNLYAWSTLAENSLMKALFPNLNRFAAAWEAHPLLSRVDFTGQQLQAPPLDKIPTILHNRSTISQLKLDSERNENDDPILSLLVVDDTPTILSQPMTHGSDYKLVKKIILPPTHANAGEEYNGMLPNPQYSIQEIMQHFHLGAFSLVINKVEQRWNSIGRMARLLEEEFGVLRVGVNLYLTPEVVSGNSKNGKVRQGFEAHWDWMDVIVIQLSGRKRWSVAREPTIYLSNKDQKRKPTKEELKDLHRYSEFTLCPGDVLYIPRGHIHNASTVIFDNLESESSDGGINLDSCPSYPEGFESAELLSNRLDGPSLHLTFGLLQGNDATIESLLHHALDAFFANVGSSSAHKRVAIPAKDCFSPDQTTVDHDIEWKSIYHRSLAEVARRAHICDGPSNQGTSKHVRCDGTVILRQSVPLLLLKNNKLNERTEDIESTPTQQYSNLKETYLLALDTFTSSASITSTIDFIQSHLIFRPSDDELIFHYHGYSEKDVILCPHTMTTLDQDEFTQLLQSFKQFATVNFYRALEDMNIWAGRRREEDRQHQQTDLELVGQGGGM